MAKRKNTLKRKSFKKKGNKSRRISRKRYRKKSMRRVKKVMKGGMG